MITKTPYIGVTDFSHYSQVREALENIPEKVNRRLHVGVMSSYKTVSGIKTQTGWEKIWPRGDILQGIFQPHPRVFNVLHYADFEVPSLTTVGHLVTICKEAGPHLHGLQLDMIWPSVHLIEEFRQIFPDTEVILQVSKLALKLLESTSKNLNEQVQMYSGVVDYFLIDSSMGRGEPMSPTYILDYVNEISLVVPPYRIAVGGGLGPSTYRLLDRIFSYSNLISCDAQGQMRSSGKATDPIEMSRVCAYLRGVSSLL